MKEKLAAFASKHIDFAFKLLRIFLPLVRFNNLVIVSRFRDVEEVLERPNIFGVTYAEKMGVVTGGSNFFLGMNNTATYERDISNMRIVMPRADVPAVIKPLCESYAQELVDKLGNELDFVADLSLRVPAHFVGTYMGTPGPDEPTLIEWTTYMFWYLFFPSYPDEVTQKATTLSADTRDYLDALIHSRKTSGQKVNDVIGRCLALQTTGTPGMTDTDIRNNLIGMMIGAVPTTSKAAALVMDYLLDNPTVLSQAQQCARQDDDEQLTSLVLEVLRFNAFNPGVFRITLEDYKLAGGRWYAKTVKKGEQVLALTQSAMMDGAAVSSPKQLLLNRPRSVYMPFGYGTHVCFGYYINLVQIPAILKPILKKSSVRRAEGDSGKLHTNDNGEGPFPVSLKLVLTD